MPGNLTVRRARTQIAPAHPCAFDEDWDGPELSEEEQRRIEDGMEAFEERRRQRIAESLEY